MADKKERPQPKFDFQAIPYSAIEWVTPGTPFSDPEGEHAVRWNEFVTLKYKPQVQFYGTRMYVIWSK